MDILLYHITDIIIDICKKYWYLLKNIDIDNIIYAKKTIDKNDKEYKEKEKARHEKYNLENKEKVYLANKEYRENNKEIIADIKKEYYQNNDFKIGVF